ncbi:hypothetical protein [Streptomyces agglomeratus]|uniref:hypothetical protein n=1 Tax=Streptomyces agglomeratus TaxID=285458 RepID=UPI0008545D1C|nr:hypothetical protein [Streptomyces agglomeratus]OEJ49656.1 hypothetical protein BGK72_01375 [Streptomyces agglomeratus]
MYEMCAEPVTGQGELLWHVISKESTANALCGHPLTSHSLRAPLPDAETLADRYCSACMTAVSSAS